MIIGRQTLPFGARRFEKTMQNIGKRPETQQKWQRYATPILNTYFVVVYYWEGDNRSNIHIDWKSKTKQRMVFAMIHIKDSLLPMGKVWSLDFQGIYTKISLSTIAMLILFEVQQPTSGFPKRHILAVKAPTINS